MKTRRDGLVTLAVTVALGLARLARAEDPSGGAGQDLWQPVAGKPAAVSPARARPAVRAVRFRTYRLDRDGLQSRLAAAPEEHGRPVTERALVLALPAPDGAFVRFAVQESPVMEPGLAARHPEIKTYSGRSLDRPGTTLRCDLTPLGFHASVRGPGGAWHIDPFYHLDQSLYASYYRGDVPRSGRPAFVEREPSPDRDLGTPVGATDRAHIPSDSRGPGPQLMVGDFLRTYRLALVTDPSYAAYFGGPANVTAAKVTLLNRIDQIYEDETSIRMVLVGDNDLLNLDTPALATGPGGPCGPTACYSAAQLASCDASTLARNRIVLGQIIGASNYDVGHLALGVNAGGSATVPAVGNGSKAHGCTGLSDPVGDGFAVDRVAHELGHQFAAHHTFNGTQAACAGGNRFAETSVEPGSGSSIMSLAGTCGADDLQPHHDPYWSPASFREIVLYTSFGWPEVNEVQNVTLSGFDADGDSFTIRYNGNDSIPIVRGANYTAAGIASAVQGIAGWPGGSVLVESFGGLGAAVTDEGFQVTFNTPPLAHTNVTALSLTSLNGVTGFVAETDKGGPAENNGVASSTGNRAPQVNTPPVRTIPQRTPFALTGSATDPDGDTLTYLWEEQDSGGANGTALTDNNKVNGPLFRQFGEAANVTPAGALQYGSPGQNAVTTNPTRVFPDLAQVLGNNTNAETGTCTNVDCFSEFLPTSSYTGLGGVLVFYLTARDGNPGAGGVSNAGVGLNLAPGAGPFLVTYPNAAVTLAGGSSQTVTWAVAGTSAAPVSCANVKISLSIDGGYTYPHVLAASTPNDGSQLVVLPNLSTSQARVKVEAVGNVFFDVSNADFTIQALGPTPIVSNDAPGSGAPAQYGGPVGPSLTISATDADSVGEALTASSPNLPAGLALMVGTTTTGPPGARTWTVSGNVTALPGTYPVTVFVTDEQAGVGMTSFDIVVSKAPTTTVVVPSANPSNAAQGVTFTATVASGTPAGGVPDGLLSFFAGATPLGARLFSGGQASVTTGGLGVGIHSITAQYSGSTTLSGSTSSVLTQEVVNPALGYYTLAPCRVVDTRGGAPVGGPPLTVAAVRTLPFAGHCGIPGTAKAVSVNVTVTQPTGYGNLKLYTAGLPTPLVSSLNYSAGQTRGNNAIVPLSPGGAMDAVAIQDPFLGTVHLIIDVNGYFE